jgi:hypothetical protein
MRRHGWSVPILVAGLALSVAHGSARAQSDDPDLPGGLAGEVDKEAYLQARSSQLNLIRGIPYDPRDNPRVAAIQEMQGQLGKMGAFTVGPAWVPIGPDPIPNGQTSVTATAVSGRVTAIVVHPFDENIVFVGTAQGGLYRSMDGGASWTPLFDEQATLAIGALALAPSDPNVLFVGTGEGNFACDSFFGLGLYRVENVLTSPTIHGPFNPTPTTDVIGAGTFTGRSISRILVHPTNPDTVFVSTASGVGGLGCDALAASPPITALRGIYRSANAMSGSPAFAKLTVTTAGSIAPDVTGNRIVSDMVYDPTDPTGNTIVCWVYGTTAAGDGGLWRTTNALAASPVFAQTFTTTVSNVRGALTANRVAGVTTMIAATGEAATGTGCTSGSGCLRRSLDGGATWSAKLTGGGGFCGGQCFYDLPVALHPLDASILLIGGASNGTCARVFARSVNGGASFTAANTADAGLHADAHAIQFAPANPNVVYEGNDGGIYRSDDAGATWSSRNTTGFSATQFQSLAVHPIDPDFTIGGTQDNGTNHYRPDGTWYRVDFGDGGFAQIDQNAPDNTNVTMYHTYFNQQSNVVGYARVTNVASAVEGGWTFLGNGVNGISSLDVVNFYAPLVLGPGNPNTVYYGTQRLYRSANNGTNHTTVSQNPIVSGVPLCAIAIAPSDDNVRLVGLNNGQIWGTVTGSGTLVNFTGGAMPARYVGRIAIDPADANVAYVSFCGFGVPAGQHVWKTTDLLSGTPTWTAAGSGIPDVPVNALAIDPAVGGQVFAGTDIGVFISNDGGANWLPFNTGLPVVAVFDMAIQNPHRMLRVATHGRGMWERSIDQSAAAVATVVGSEIVDGRVRVTWNIGAAGGAPVTIYRRSVPGDWERRGDAALDGSGIVVHEDAEARPGRSYQYRLGMHAGNAETFAGEIWVDVPVEGALVLSRIVPNPTTSRFTVTFALPTPAPATIALVDLAGRQVESHEVGGMGAGAHTVKLGGSGPLPTGVYWVRLMHAGRSVSRQVSVIR